MEHLMVPYSKAALNDANRIYNYRHSRARRIVESTFGLLCARWRLLLKPVETSLAKVEGIIHSILCLHNFLIDEMGEPFSANFTLEDAARECTLGQAQMRSRRANHGPRYADDVRRILTEWFNGEGAVEWQNDHVFYQPTQAATQGEEGDEETLEADD
ncbi:nuclease HARBI1-like protein [Aphelenchoides avenae]|nr:nuclease HARBI1-like protein [Aphelenchus avenae]